MERFLRTNIFRREKVKKIDSRFILEDVNRLLDTVENKTKIPTTFKNFDAVDLAEIEFFHEILLKMGKVLVTTESEGLKEYIEWYSQRYHISEDKRIYFVGNQFVTENIFVRADLNRMSFVEDMMRSSGPFDILVQDLDKTTLTLLKEGGDAIIRCPKYDKKIMTIVAMFDKIVTINSAANTKMVYIVCKNKLRQPKEVEDVNPEVSSAFIDAYVVSKTDMLNFNQIAYTYDLDKINELWQLPKKKNIIFIEDVCRHPSTIDLSDVAKTEYSFKKAPEEKVLKVKKINLKPMIDNGIVSFEDNGVDESVLFSSDLLFPKEKYYMRSFTQRECIEIMLNSDEYLKRLYRFLQKDM